MLFSASLRGKSSVEMGHLMMTNYRVVFFKEGVKRVDLPFGLLQEVEHSEKELTVVFRLKYPHSWKFRIISPKSKFKLLKTIGLAYIKPSQVKEKFCFSHFRKCKQDQKPYFFCLQEEYERLELFSQSELFRYQNNTDFKVTASYPPFFVIIMIVSLSPTPSPKL